VDHEPPVEIPVMQGLLEGVEHQICPHGRVSAPTHDAPGEHVDHERHVHDAAPRGDVREVRHPELVGALRRELPLHEVLRTRRRGVGARGDRALPAHDAAKPGVPHEARDRAPGDGHALTTELAPDLPHAGHLVMLRAHPLDTLPQRGIALRARGPAGHVPLLLVVAVIARRSDL